MQGSPTSVRSWLASNRGQSKLFGLAGVVLAGVAIFANTRWFPIGLAAAVPWIALAINRASRGRFGFAPREPGKNPLLTYWVFAGAPVIALLVLGAHQYSPMSLGPIILASIVLGTLAAIAFFSLVVWPRKRRPDPLLKALGGVGFIGYAYGCLAIANGMLPQAPPAQLEVRIVSKHIATGRNQPRMFVLEPWGPYRSGAVRGTLVMYDQLDPGQTVCILLYPGGLGMPRWEIAPWTARRADPDCPRQVQTNAPLEVFVAPPS